MSISRRACKTEDDFFNIRNFLREVFLLNDRLEHSWNVARFDYWRYHHIQTCHVCPPFDQVTVAWVTDTGKIVAVLHPILQNEIRLHIHPGFRTLELEDEIFAYAEQHFSSQTGDGNRILYAPVFSDDHLRQEVLTRHGFTNPPGWGHHWRRDLDSPLPVAPIPKGFVIRSMGPVAEHPARSLASWKAFHSEEQDGRYDGDFSWYQNIQSAPLYRRDLDIVAATPGGDIAAFCTIYYDDATRSAITVLVGTASEHWRCGLGRAVTIEGFQRLKIMGCTRVFSTATEEPADALYGSVMQEMKVTDTWVKVSKA